MNVRRLIFSIAAFVAIAPTILMATSAADGGLVPCGDDGDRACEVCHAVDLMNNISAWLVGVLSVAAAIMFVISGYRLVTAGGNPSVMKEAKGVITNVAIGFVIVLAAWLGIDLVMKTLLTGGETSLGPWNTLECVTQPSYESVPLEFSSISTSQSCSDVDDCAARALECESRTDGVATVAGSPGALRVDCEFTSGHTADSPPDLSATGACDPSVVANYFPDQVGNAQCIIRDESTCGAGMVSTTDVMSGDGRAFSFGPMQINLTWHELEGCGPGGSTLNCADAFDGRNYSAVVVDEDLYQACAAAAQSLECGLSNGRRIQQRDGWGPWSTAAGCGLI